jgi:hypothetical protein
MELLIGAIYKYFSKDRRQCTTGFTVIWKRFDLFAFKSTFLREQAYEEAHFYFNA